MWHTYTGTLDNGKIMQHRFLTNETGKEKEIQREIVGLMAMTMAMTMTANISELMLMRRNICNPMKRIAIVDDDDDDDDDDDADDDGDDDGDGNER